MKTIQYILIFISVSCVFTTIYLAINSEETKSSLNNEMKMPNGRYLYKLTYEGHSYVFLRNSWSAAGDKLLHDPDCQCKNKILAD